MNARHLRYPCKNYACSGKSKFWIALFKLKCASTFIILFCASQVGKAGIFSSHYRDKKQLWGDSMTYASSGEFRIWTAPIWVQVFFYYTCCSTTSPIPYTPFRTNCHLVNGKKLGSNLNCTWHSNKWPRHLIGILAKEQS